MIMYPTVDGILADFACDFPQPVSIIKFTLYHLMTSIQLFVFLCVFVCVMRGRLSVHLFQFM